MIVSSREEEKYAMDILNESLEEFEVGKKNALDIFVTITSYRTSFLNCISGSTIISTTNT